MDVKRIQTAAILIGVLALVLFMDSVFIYWTLFVALMVASIYEIQNFYKIENITFMYSLVAGVAVFSYFFELAHLAVLLALIGVCSYFAFRNEFDNVIIKTLIYPILPLGFFFSFATEHGATYLLWLVVVVSLSDTGAYFVGKQIGKTSFSPSSPNKTMEGFAGALVIGSIAGSFCGVLLDYSWVMSFGISLVVSFFSVFGDLFESHLKRQAGIKDSSDLLPGHGGVLDRIDGFLFALPVFYILLEIINS